MPTILLLIAVLTVANVEATEEPSVPTSPPPSRKLTITVHNMMRLYIDGIEKTGLANANDWTKADTVDLPWTASVVAVQGTNLGDVGGILASTDDFTVVNNPELWKCTNVYHDGWQLVDFDDSSWPSAYAIGVHQTCPWTLIPGIKRNAYWIWTYKYNGGDLVVYCRINSVSSIPTLGLPCHWRHLTITTDNIMRLYVDGYEEHVGHGANCMGVEILQISWIARVIAVKVNDVSVVAGILVSTDSGFVLTESWWKCTNVYYEGWGSWTFDDSSWPWASVNGVHQTSPTTPVQGIGTDPTTPVQGIGTDPTTPVQGIGTDPAWMSTTTGDSGVYCRRILDDSRACEYT